MEFAPTGMTKNRNNPTAVGKTINFIIPVGVDASATLDNDMENPTTVNERIVSISLPCVKEGGLRSKTEGL